MPGYKGLPIGSIVVAFGITIWHPKYKPQKDTTKEPMGDSSGEVHGLRVEGLKVLWTRKLRVDRVYRA